MVISRATLRTKRTVVVRIPSRRFFDIDSDDHITSDDELDNFFATKVLNRWIMQYTKFPNTSKQLQILRVCHRPLWSEVIEER